MVTLKNTGQDDGHPATARERFKAANQQANALLNSVRPRTGRPGARFDLATQIGLAMGLAVAGHPDQALKVLEEARGSAVKGGVSRKLEAIIRTLAGESADSARSGAAAS